MSGGERSRKKVPSQGWEEAGAEFYQESYPSNEAEFDVIVLQRDPKHLATLLPSKQTRVAATTMTKTFRKNAAGVGAGGTSGAGVANTRCRRGRPAVESLHRRASTVGGEVHVAMLPDLSENLSNEQRTWEEIMLIKALPVSMAQKREMKSKLQSEPNLRLQGFEQLKWKRRKIWDKVTANLREAYSRLELWRSDLKNIEGNCGTGIVAYFLFVKWILLLNACIFLLIFAFVVLPSVLLADKNESTSCIENNDNIIIVEDYAAQTNRSGNSNGSGTNAFFDFIQGTGYVESTLLFYGSYSNQTFTYRINGMHLYYDLPLAYLCATVIYFLFSLIAIVRAAAKGFKERLVEGEGQFYRFCDLVFGGWDFCIHNAKTAETKYKAIFNEIKGLLEVERQRDERKNRTQQERIKLMIVRIIVNLVVLVVLVGCAIGIYSIFEYSNEALRDLPIQKSGVFFITGPSFKRLEKLLYEFLPALCIVLMNLVIPWIFKYLVTFEKLDPNNVIRVTLMRTVFLRLSSLLVLYASLYIKVSCLSLSSSTDCLSVSECSCWETFVGQQIYKLFLVDFALHFFLTFFVNFPRALLARHSHSRLAKFVGAQTFELPKHVLDTTYSQTLCWLGAFYTPLLPLAATISCFLTFYVKKFACLVNASSPSVTIYHASRSNSMFMLVLLISYVTAVLPIAFAIGELTPSRTCGPFRQGLSTVWSYVVGVFEAAPVWLQQILFFVSTAGFAVPAFVIVSLALYYYWAISSANRHMVVVLKNQLVLEGHDKQFLLDRLSMYIKQQQEAAVAAKAKQSRRGGGSTGGGGESIAASGNNTKTSEESHDVTTSSN